MSVLLHVRPHRSIQAHHAIGTGVCVDPIARLMCCLLRSIRKWLFVKSFPKKIKQRKLKGNDILHFFCPYTMMMMSRSRTRLLSKKSSKKRGTRRAAKRDGICSSIFHFALFKTSLLLMILSAILMSENFEFSPVGVEGKKQRQKSSSSSSFEAFQNERREKRGTLGSRSVFLSHSVFLVFFFSIPRSYRLCLLRVTINNNSRWI